ncbi:MAG: glycosyltransferase, partial [Magnetospirillum sp.]
MMEARIALSYYPLPTRYLAALEEKAGGPIRNLVISGLKGSGTLDILAQLFRLRVNTVYVPTPERDWIAFTPLLRLIARVPHPCRVILTDERLTFHDDQLWHILPLLLDIILRTVAAIGTTVVQFWRLRRLLAAGRQDCAFPEEVSKILYIKSNLWAGVTAGGSVSHTAGVIKALSDLGRRVFFVSPGDAPELAAIPGTRVNRVTLGGGFIYPREFNSHRYNDVLARWVKRLPKHRFAFIYHRLSLGSFVAVTAARRLGIPLVVEYNGSEVWINRNWGTRLKLERLAIMAEDAVLRHAHLVVTVSAPLRRELITRGIEPNRIVSHPNGFDQSRFDPSLFSHDDVLGVRKELGIPADAVVATFVGTFGMWHGADILAQALIHLKRERPDWLEVSRLHVVFVGDGVNRASVEAILADHGLQRYYSFTGLVPPHQTPRYLAASDFFVAPHVPNPDGSEFFGSPTKLFEYMGMGRPVLASELAQIGEVLNGSPRLETAGITDGPALEGQCGLLACPADPTELAEGLAYITDHPVWRRSAGENARRRALESFTWRHHVGAILDGLRHSLPVAPPQPRRPSPRILINAVHSKSGGGLTYLRNTLPLLAGTHHFDVHLAAQADQETDIRPICAEAGVCLHVLPTWSRLATVLVQEQVTIPWLARRVGASVVFSPANYGPVFGGRKVILLRNAFEVTSLEERFSKRVYWLGVKLLTQLCFATCRRAIVVSAHAGQTFLNVFGLGDDPRLSVVHHGVGGTFHPPAQGEERIPHRLLAVSDIYVQKNFETLLRALALLVPDYPDIRLDIAGKELDPAYAGQLRALCRTLGIEDRVVFLGSLPPERIAELYRKSDLFIFPSLVETFGNPLVEAMASGIPVVCTDAAAMPEVVDGAALLAQPRDEIEMAGHIARLLNDRSLWREMS